MKSEQGRGVPGQGSTGEGLILAYLGGLRSGKSALAGRRFGEEAARRGLRSPAYLGTLLPPGEGGDGETARRLQAHRASRPAAWTLVEVGRRLPRAAEHCVAAGHDAWLLDGLGAWAALNLESPDQALAEWRAFMDRALRVPLLVLVLDEVGQGGVPGHAVARAFADLNGTLNQRACALAHEAWGVQAGLAWRLK